MNQWLYVMKDSAVEFICPCKTFLKMSLNYTKQKHGTTISLFTVTLKLNSTPFWAIFHQ